MDSNGVQHASLKGSSHCLPGLQPGEGTVSEPSHNKNRKVAVQDEHLRKVHCRSRLKDTMSICEGLKSFEWRKYFFAILEYLVIPNPFFLGHRAKKVIKKRLTADVGHLVGAHGSVGVSRHL